MSAWRNGNAERRTTINFEDVISRLDGRITRSGPLTSGVTKIQSRFNPCRVHFL